MMNVRTKAILGLAGVFLAGGVVGASILGIIVRDRVQSARALREHEGFLRFVERRLDLTVAQRDSLQKELEDLYTRLSDVRRSAADQVNAALDTFRMKVEPKLTPHQRELLGRQEEFLRHGLPPPHHGPGMMQHGGPPMDAPVRPPFMDGPPPAWNDSMGPHARRRDRMRLDDRDSLAPQVDGDLDGADPGAAGDSSFDPAGRLQRRLAHLSAQLKLTTAQQASIKQIAESARAEGRRIATETSDQPYRRRMEFRRLVGETRRQIFGVLTDDQRQLLRDRRSDPKGNSFERNTTP